MARIVVVNIKCDRCGADATSDHPDVRFAYRGINYAVDLCDPCAQSLDTALNSFVDVALRADAYDRRLGNDRKGGSYIDGRRRVERNADKLAEIRTWARANGFTVADRGRIPAEAERAYQAAHA